MRLTTDQISIIRSVASRLLGDYVEIRLFGSRTDDGTKGGDIDLFFETPLTLSNRAQTICKLYGSLVMALGDRKIDIIVKDVATPNAGIFDIAKQTGIVL